MKFTDSTKPATLRSNQFRGIGIGTMFVLHSYKEAYLGTDNRSVVYIKISLNEAVPLTGGTQSPSKFGPIVQVHIVRIEEIVYKRLHLETE